MRRVVSATEARVHFGELLRRVREGGDTVFVERGGRPQVVVLGIPEYERLLAAQGSAGWREVAGKARELLRAEIGDRRIPPAEEVIRAAREERDERLTGLR